jgi:hypothetical protein
MDAVNCNIYWWTVVLGPRPVSSLQSIYLYDIGPGARL